MNDPPSQGMPSLLKVKMHHQGIDNQRGCDNALTPVHHSIPFPTNQAPVKERPLAYSARLDHNHDSFVLGGSVLVPYFVLLAYRTNAPFIACGWCSAAEPQCCLVMMEIAMARCVNYHTTPKRENMSPSDVMLVRAANTDDLTRDSLESLGLIRSSLLRRPSMQT